MRGVDVGPEFAQPAASTAKPTASAAGLALSPGRPTVAAVQPEAAVVQRKAAAKALAQPGAASRAPRRARNREAGVDVNCGSTGLQGVDRAPAVSRGVQG